MPDRLDVATHFLHLAGGQTLPDEPPGFATLAAPRKAARGRERDVLFLCLGLRSRAPILPERFAELLDLAAATFFGSPGSITSALRQALAAVNQKLLDLNLRAGMPVQGGLIGAVLRGADFYAVQSGPGLVLVARGLGLERFPHTPSRPLGLSNTLDAQYFHTTVNEGEYFSLSQMPAPGWSEAALAGLGSLSTLTAVTERLKEAANGDCIALVGRFEPDGAVAALPPAPGPSVAPPASPGRESRRIGLPMLFKPRPALSERSRPEFAASEASPLESVAQSVEALAARQLPPDTDWPARLQRAKNTETVPPQTPIVEGAPSLIQREARPQGESLFGAVGASVKSGLQSFGRALGVTLTEASRSVRRLLARILPEGMLQKDGLFAVPTSVLIGLAIVIPLLVVSIAVGLYLQRGRAELFADALSQAQVEVATARLTSDPLAARPHWEMALDFLDQAEGVSPNNTAVTTLQQEAQGKLDELDWITRLDYQPLVVGGLGRGVKVKRILLIGQDVYALDEAHNRIFHLMPTPQLGYTVDPNFGCSGGQPVGQVNIGELQDMGLLPGPNVMGQDAVVALDTTGGLLYCAPGVEPLAIYLQTPDTGWIRPMALEVYADRLYVLDPGISEVWQFLASGGAFNQPPAHYFTGVSYNLADVIEFSIAGGDLFLLHQDGRIANCSRADAGETATCVEAALFTDPRPGRAPGDRPTDVTAPTLLAYDPPPEPSLYLLDQDSGGIYQLSLKLALVRQFRAFRSPFAPSAISAVAIDQAKRFFVGAGDNVYIAARP